MLGTMKYLSLIKYIVQLDFMSYVVDKLFQLCLCSHSEEVSEMTQGYIWLLQSSLFLKAFLF